ncbi:hypothetical protein VZ231_24055, partial [Enterobacter hormaechei]|uniref:hypothetical protein n=1 Tax=Enterobacter hormaechei TaxID=158836 RepID=UPI002E2E89F4
INKPDTEVPESSQTSLGTRPTLEIGVPSVNLTPVREPGVDVFFVWAWRKETLGRKISINMQMLVAKRSPEKMKKKASGS